MWPVDAPDISDMQEHEAGIRLLRICDDMEREGKASPDQIGELRQSARALMHPAAMAKVQQDGTAIGLVVFLLILAACLGVSWAMAELAACL